MLGTERAASRKPGALAARAVPGETVPARGDRLPPHVLDTRRPAPLDRVLPDRDRLGLQRVVSGSAPPRLPPILPPTAFDRPPPEDFSAVAREPLPFHQAWVLAALLGWAGIWLTCYVASAWLLRPGV